jgi:hypothetical protein
MRRRRVDALDQFREIRAIREKLFDREMMHD